MSDATASAAAIHDIAARHGRLDILVSNAATTVRKPVLEQTDDDWARVIETDLTSGFRMARDAGRIMAKAGYGRIVFTSSINDDRAAWHGGLCDCEDGLVWDWYG